MCIFLVRPWGTQYSTCGLPRPIYYFPISSSWRQDMRGRPSPALPLLTVHPGLGKSCISTGYLPISGGLIQSLEAVLTMCSPNLPSQEVSSWGRWPGTGPRICRKLQLSFHKWALEEGGLRSAQKERMLQAAMSSLARRALKRVQRAGCFSVSNYPFYLCSGPSPYLSVFIALSHYCLALRG